MESYIIVSRQTGELYDGNNVRRFYDSIGTVKGQTNQNLYTILKVTLGADPGFEQVASCSRTSTEFYDGISEELEREEEHRDYCIKELKKEPNDGWLKTLLKQDLKQIEELKSLRYGDLVWK